LFDPGGRFRYEAQNSGEGDESERRGLAGSVIAARFLHKPIELPGLDVRHEVAVPGCPVELQKPGTELSELLRRERLDLPFSRGAAERAGSSIHVSKHPQLTRGERAR
jgi:hypothetical protein